MGALPGLSLWLIAYVYAALTGKEGMGLGDVKLLILIGAAIGPMGGLHVLYVSALQGLVIGSLVVATGGHEGADEDNRVEFEDGWEPPPRAVPFGPFLVLGAFQVVLFADFFESLPFVVSQWLVEKLL
jgi:leader peptidase (prepilin peptidase)/N-methyltransferase